ncbi:MAG: hypothetical protein ABH872_02590 [Candidatus Omnitrophota bacterium]
MSTELKKIIEDYLPKIKEKAQTSDKILKTAAKVLNRNLMPAVEFGGINKNCVLFICLTPAHLYECTLLKNDLLNVIRGDFPEINEIKLKLKY